MRKGAIRRSVCVVLIGLWVCPKTSLTASLLLTPPQPHSSAEFFCTALAGRALLFGGRSPRFLASWLDRSAARFMILDSPQELAITAAREIAIRIRANNAAGRPTVLILPTGSTPIPVYDELARMHRDEELSFRHVHTFNMDEYYVGPRYPGVWAQQEQSYRMFMEHYLFSRVDIPTENIHFLNGQASDFDAEAKRYEDELHRLAQNGADIAVGGIGTRGHVAFNEAVIVIDEHFFKLHPAVQAEILGTHNEFLLKNPSEAVLESVLHGHEEFRAGTEFQRWLGKRFLEADPNAGAKDGLQKVAETLRGQRVKIYFDGSDRRYAALEWHLGTLARQKRFSFPVGLSDARDITHSRTRLVDLALSTIIDNSRNFKILNEIPIQAMTIGLGTYRESQHTIVLATGEKKIPPLAALMHGLSSIENPVSAIVRDLHHLLLADREAAPLKRSRRELLGLAKKVYASEGQFIPDPLDVFAQTFDLVGMGGKSVVILGGPQGRELAAAAASGARRVIGFEREEAFVAGEQKMLRRLSQQPGWTENTGILELRKITARHIADSLDADIVVFTDAPMFRDQFQDGHLVGEIAPGALLIVFQVVAPLPITHLLAPVFVPNLPAGVAVYTRLPNPPTTEKRDLREAS